MIDILEFSSDELKKHFAGNDIKAFRASQIIDWVYKKHVFEFKQMLNLPKQLRTLLIQKYKIGVPTLNTMQVSDMDGTKKYLWELHDGERIESVLLTYPKRISACISTQVGCKLNCSFCATGKGGFKRNLKVSEITGQILAMEKENAQRIGNVVFMGMGEPMLNYENLKKSIGNINARDMFDVSKRRIAVSTAGIIPGMMMMANDFPEVVLSVSLHAPNDEIRNQLMPISRKYPYEALLNTIKEYNEKTGKRVTIEYVLIKGINDSHESALLLAGKLKDLKINVNLIPVNPVEEKYERPGEKHVADFKNTLEKYGIETVIRHEKSTDIDGACGQLKTNKS